MTSPLPYAHDVQHWLARLRAQLSYLELRQSLDTLAAQYQQPSVLLLHDAATAHHHWPTFVSQVVNIDTAVSTGLMGHLQTACVLVTVGDMSPVVGALHTLPPSTLWMLHVGSAPDLMRKPLLVTEPPSDLPHLIDALYQDAGLKKLSWLLQLKQWYLAVQIQQRYQEEQNKRYPHGRIERLSTQVQEQIDTLKMKEREIALDLKGFFERLLVSIQLDKDQLSGTDESLYQSPKNYFIIPISVSSSLSTDELYLSELKTTTSYQMGLRQGAFKWMTSATILCVINPKHQEEINKKTYAMVKGRLRTDVRLAEKMIAQKMSMISQEIGGVSATSYNFSPSLSLQESEIDQKIKTFVFYSDFNKSFIRGGFFRKLKDSRMHASTILSFFMIFNILLVLLFEIDRAELMKILPMVALGLMVLMLTLLYVFRDNLEDEKLNDITEQAKLYVRNGLDRHLDQIEKCRVEEWKKYFYQLQESYTGLFVSEIKKNIQRLEAKKAGLSSKIEMSSGLGGLSSSTNPPWLMDLEKNKILLESQTQQSLQKILTTHKQGEPS